MTLTTWLTSSSGCSAVTLIGRLATRDGWRRELARDVCKEELLFIGCGSSKGNDANAFRRLGVNDRHRSAIEKAERHEALLAVAEPVVFVSDRQASENLRCVDEVETVQPNVGSTLLFIPLKPHLQSVYTGQGEGNNRAAV